jgi:Tol biopolymer transport system component
VKSCWRACAFVILAGVLSYPQPAPVAPPESLVVEQVPAIPASLAETVERYGNSRGANLVSWHPTRREMLVTTRFADTNQIHAVAMPGGARSQLTFYPDAVFQAAYQPTKGEFFIFSKDEGGGEFFQLYRYERDSSDVTLLTDGKSRNTGPVWSNAGDKVIYGSTRRTGNDVDLYLIDPTDPKSDHMLAQLKGGGWFARDWSPDDRQILVVEEISANESYLWLVDANSGQMTLITPKGGATKIAYSGGRFSKDGKGIYVTTDKDSEFQRLAYIDLGTSTHISPLVFPGTSMSSTFPKMASALHSSATKTGLAFCMCSIPLPARSSPFPACLKA